MRTALLVVVLMAGFAFVVVEGWVVYQLAVHAARATLGGG